MTPLLDIDLLRTLLAIADRGGFTAAARELGISQSTVSRQIGRLESVCGRSLLERDTHSVRLTTDGAVLVEIARGIVAASRQAADYFSEARPRGKVRLGVAKDLALTRFARLLREIRRSHPDLDVELTVGLSAVLYRELDAGRLDLVLAKRFADDPRGRLVHRDTLRWIAHRDFALRPDASVPLVIYPEDSITTSLAQATLTGAGRAWHVSCSSPSLSGLRAGASAGLGVMAQSALLLDEPGTELAVVPGSAGLPPLPAVDIVVLGRSERLTGAVRALGQMIDEHGAALWNEKAAIG